MPSFLSGVRPSTAALPSSVAGRMNAAATAVNGPGATIPGVGPLGANARPRRRG